MRWKVWLLAPMLLLLVSQPADSRPGQYLIQFREHLDIATDLRLTGARSSSSVRFASESTWKPISGTTLHLFIDHSPELDGNRSFLSVTLNYGVLRSVRLDKHNQSTTEITIPLPPGMLQPENEIVFSVEQFPLQGHPNEIWTAIKPSSFIAVQYEENRPALDLRLLPSPLVDPHSYRPKHLSVLLPVRPSSQTLEATAQLIANYAAKLGEALTVHAVRSIDGATGQLLIVGTAEEQPLKLLEKQLPFELFRVSNQIRLGGNQGPFNAQEGIVALIEKPGRTFTPILLATGNSPDAVSRAVRKLIVGQFEGPGRFARVSQDVSIAPLSRREWKGFMPPDNHFTLAQMGFKELRFDSQNGFSLSLPMLATPDAQFLEYGHQMTLAFRFNSGVSIENTKLEVDLNGSMLGQMDAAEFPPGSRMSIRLKIPAHLLRQQNVLKMTWRGLDGTADTESAAWLLPMSEFDLPRDYRSNLPDLRLLRFGLFPFGLRPDLSDAVIVLPPDSNDSSGEAAAALFEFAGLLGRLVPAHRFAFGVKYQEELNPEVRNSSHIIAFRIGELPKGTQSRRAVAAIQESVSPWNAERYLLSITSSSPAALRAAMKTVFSDATFKQLRDDTAYIYFDGVSTFKTASVQEIHQYSYFTHLQAWLRENWIALPVILTIVSCLLFAGLRLILVQYKSRKLLRRGLAQ
jgi:hypothetical protein